MAIYGHPTAGKQTMTKSDFYEMYGAGFRSLCIGSERNPQRHGQMKKSLSAAFSTKALAEQERIVMMVIDDFVARIGQDGGPGTGGLNMTKWYEMCAFDILGEMAFGESFNCIETGSLGKPPPLLLPHFLSFCFFFFGWQLKRDVLESGKPHFWAELILDHLYFITLADNLRRFPLVVTLTKWFFPSTIAAQSKNSEYSRKQVSRWVGNGMITPRKDIS